MAMGILLGSEQVVAGPVRTAVIGELSLGAEVQPVPGILPMVSVLARRGVRRVLVASAAVDEARLAGGIEVTGVDTPHATVRERDLAGCSSTSCPSSGGNVHSA
jgi:predicted ATPase with chaperone activity